MLTALYKTPFPWFGGKTDAAPIIWEALGDCEHYVEPFAGSLAVLMRRPHECNRTYYSETVNDIDGLLVNAWRSLQWSPDATAEAASWPVSEADLMARHIALVKWREERQLEHLMGDPAFHDPVMAGWWMWGQSCWIGSGWCAGTGAWWADDSGRIFKRERARNRDNGADRKRPHLGDNGQGVNHAGTREQGVGNQLPHLSGDGQGVNHAGTREQGVGNQLPHLSGDGRGVNHAGTREQGVKNQLPHLSGDGRGVNRPQMREPGCGDEPDFHPMTMPELLRWMRWLSARLRHVRILNGDWKRAVTGGASKTLSVRMGGGHCGIFLDPPYSDVRADGLYASDSLTVAHDVRDWCVANGADPRLRIALAGFDSEHTELEALGWRAVEWYRSGFLKGGMANVGSDATQQDRERIWFSPHCLQPAEAITARQIAMFG
jgi:hypothetical protein